MPLLASVVVVAAAVPPKVKPFATVICAPPLKVITTLTAPAAWAGSVAVRVVAFTHVTLVAATPPKVIEETPEGKSVPLTVIPMPPLIGPVAGLTPVTLEPLTVTSMRSMHGFGLPLSTTNWMVLTPPYT